MASTQNLDLVKPAGTDKALVSVINSNSDKIDAFASTTNQAISTLNSNMPIIKTVEHAIPNDTDAHIYDLPTGMNTAIFIGARCFTRYDSWVDSSYANGEYFGGIGFMAGNGKFRYTAKTAGNSTRISFAFLKVT